MTEFKNEREFQRTLIREAKKRGWIRVHQEGSSFGSRPGWPDVTLVHGGEEYTETVNGKARKRWRATDEASKGILFFELKVGKRQMTPYQEDWIAALQYAGMKAFHVRPEHWESIIRLLDGEDVTIGESDTPQMGLEL